MKEDDLLNIIKNTNITISENEMILLSKKLKEEINKYIECLYDNNLTTLRCLLCNCKDLLIFDAKIINNVITYNLVCKNCGRKAVVTEDWKNYSSYSKISDKCDLGDICCRHKDE